MQSAIGFSSLVANATKLFSKQKDVLKRTKRYNTCKAFLLDR